MKLHSAAPAVIGAALAAAALTSAPTALAQRSGTPTLAVEDTMRTELPPQFVRAQRLTLDDILDRVAAGEARRDSAIQDQAYTASFRLVRHTAEKNKQPELMSETVMRVFKKRPDRVRSIELRKWELKPPKDDDRHAINVEVSSDTDEEIVNFAFQPEGRRAYKFRIVGRDWLGGNRLVYRIQFEPRSSLDFEHPRGEVWVDTNDFVIVHQELEFDRSPVPIILKGVDRMVVERRRVDGHWVLARVVLRGRFSLPIPTVGRSFDLSMRFDDYAINRGIPESVFVASGGSK